MSLKDFDLFENEGDGSNWDTISNSLDEIISDKVEDKEIVSKIKEVHSNISSLFNSIKF